MAILNYTTSISTEKTAAEIQKKLSKAKVQAVLCEYNDDAVVSAISFRIMTKHGMIFFRLPVNIQGVFKKLKTDQKVPRKLRTKEQAAKVALRILKDWVEAQLAIVDAEMADMLEVFLPYAQGHDGQTMYETVNEKGLMMLTHDKPKNND